MTGLFDALTVRDLVLQNRIVMAPMNMYMADEDGRANDKHLIHYGARVVGGVGLVLTENVGISPDGRTSPADLGLWSDDQIEGLRRITALVHAYGAKIGIQLEHAGRKSKVAAAPVAPSALAFPGLPVPTALDAAGIRAIIGEYVAAAERALRAGFDCVEIHAAHGYLLHEFVSPLTNIRTDEYGGALENRMRLLVEVATAVRAVIPPGMPLIVRFSGGDVEPGGSDLEESVVIAGRLAEVGVDIFSVSTGNVLAGYAAPVFPGYQVPSATEIKKRAGVTVAASGSITSDELAEFLVATDAVDLVLLGRPLIDDPHWALRAARVRGLEITPPEPIYARATGPYQRGF